MQIANVNAFAQPILMQRRQQAQNAFAAYGRGTEPAYPTTPHNAFTPLEGPPGTPQTGGSEWLRYANGGAVRNLPLSDKLVSALSFLSDMGIEMEVFSGGQHEKGSGHKRVGSTRHDHGHAADVFFHKDGRRLDWANPSDLPIFQEIVSRARANGITGIGAGEGYMRPGSMHIGFGNDAVWGAGGKGANAPGWLREAYNTPYRAQANPGFDPLTFLGL